MDVELQEPRFNGSGRKERQIQLQVWDVSWWVQAAGLVCENIMLFVWVKPTFVTQQK